jgi:diguanylate cyclase (GGDEF)-like protein
MGAPPAHTETMSLAVGQPTAADYARASELGSSWLRFPSPVEEEFRRAHAMRVRGQARFWQLLQLVLGLIGLRLVLVGAAPEAPKALLVACAGAHIAVSVALVAVAFSRRYARSYLRTASIITPLRTAAHATVVAAIIANGGLGTAAMTVNMFGLLFFSGLPLRQALPAAGTMIACFAAALTAFEAQAGLATYAVASLLVVFGLAGFVAWDTQRAARIAFLEHGLVRADASRDALTGLANRRQFDARLESLWQAAAKKGQPLTVMLVDVDHFKGYNDHYGHQAGDEALRAVARAIAAEAGPDAVAARFGGEEMAVLAPALGEHEAEALGGRIRRAVEALGIAHAGAPGGGCVTVSVGGTCLVPLPGRSASGALQLADQNLYVAKRNGRNRAVFRVEDYTAMQTGLFRHDGPKS